jgi:hypothetical protein
METQPYLTNQHPRLQFAGLIQQWRSSLGMEHSDLELDQNCGTIERRDNLSDALVERMKIVFRKTHGGEMTQEDRNFLGIPPCTGECCS